MMNTPTPHSATSAGSRAGLPRGAARLPRWLAGLVGVVVAPAALVAQDRLRTMPGYEQHERMAPQMVSAVKSGARAAVWSADSRSLEYSLDGKRYRFDLPERRETEIPAASPERAPSPARAVVQPDRGRQFESAVSPDGHLTAFYRDRNLWIKGGDSPGETAVTTDGSPASRVKYGTASWVYGEELEQRTAMWWSPDGRALAYYRFDERPVPDYYVALDQTRLQDTIDVEAYPKAGVPNPVVDLFVYDLATKRSTRIDVRDGRPFDDAVVGHYVYHVMWTPDGRDLLFFRTNRRQNTMEVVAADPATGTCRVILRETWPTGWVNEDPRLVFLRDGRRFIWESQRNGWDNFYLYDLTGRLITPLTAYTSTEVGTLVKVDEEAGVVFYTARDGDNALKFQLHRVGLDGTGDRRLTDPTFHHAIGLCMDDAGPRTGQPAAPAPCGISPDSRYFVDVYQRHDTPPATRVVDAATGGTVADVAQSDTTQFSRLGLEHAELFSFLAADGKTRLHGILQFPSGFSASKKYPLLVNAYGGPEFAYLTARETFVQPSALAEYGFLVVTLDSRAIPGLGKRTLDAIYGKLGQTEVDDMAAGVEALRHRSYVDRARVGIFGTSYGGYVALMAMLRHPGLFAAAVASSAPTDWRNYDSIYTERYMNLPQDNAAGYDEGSAVVHAGALKGRVLLYYGTADNNVHPANTLQLVQALEKAGKSFDLQVGPDRGHSAVSSERMMQFFLEALVLDAATARSRR
jgi:dipeptidyl-peptidase-4